mmetsp:Transcript_6985/g.9372  ORF Transcript_6985/g.9372 Transcript_6985/m.9372 type:complete len:199 (+) Transcript_6985:121-717(+)
MMISSGLRRSSILITKSTFLFSEARKRALLRSPCLVSVRSFAGLGKGFDILADYDDLQPKTIIEGYDSWGFTIKGIRAQGAVLAFGTHYMLWRPQRFEDVTKDSLELVSFVKPKIEILVVGCGPTIPNLLRKDIMMHFKDKGISLEVMNTMNACATFNILNAEGRNVAAALLPMDPKVEIHADRYIGLPSIQERLPSA